MIALGSRSYRLLWIALMALHVLHALAYGKEALVFLSLMVYDSALNRGLQVFRLEHTFNASVSASMLVSSTIVSTWHGMAVLRALFGSLRQNKLAFSLRLLASDRGVSSSLQSWNKRRVASAVAPPLRRVYSAWLGVFGIDSEHFDNVRDFRELVEIATQTYLVYVTSTKISSRFLTSFCTVALALNCWSTPLIDFVWRKDNCKARYFRLLIGIWLACCFTMLLRALQYYPYISDYTHAKWYNLEWTVSSIAQLLHMIINSWPDMIMNRLNLLTMTAAMETLKTAVVPIAVSLSARRRRVLFYVYGAGILGLHVSATTQSPFIEPRDGAICHLEVHPWLQKHSSCVVLEINCYRLGIQGSAAEVDAELRNVNAKAVRGLIFSHCPRLEVPSVIREFENLFGVEIYNSSIVTWGEDAALTTDLHPALVVLRLILVQGITELPPGLLSPKFPVNDVEFVLTDLASLPDDLETKWSHMIEILAIEGSRLTRVPEFVINAQISTLSLGSNGIQAVPEKLFTNHSFELLMLSGNPIRELPAQLSGGGNSNFHCSQLLVQSTEIAAIPEWTITSTGQVFAGSTPYCMLNPSSASNLSGHTVDCTPFLFAVALAFPLPFHAQLRQP